MLLEDLEKRIRAITQFSKEDVDKFLELGKPFTFSSNSYLLKVEQPVNDLYFFKTGILRQYVVNKEGVEFTKHFIVAPRFGFPSLSDFFMRTPSITYCQALTDVETIQWSFNDLVNYADKRPKIYRFIIQTIIEAYRHKEEREIQLNQLPALERYEKFLLEFPTLVNHVPLQYIASYLSIRPETLSRLRARRIS
jgi:CRP/FNR family transcriptional regulator, anaerobic regulatory protein